MLDILITNARILRGDGSASFIGNVGIQGDRISFIGSDAPQSAQIINAIGLCLAPGFVDIHTHSELTLMANPWGQSKLMQGVTTEVTGNCGLTAFPLASPDRRQSLSFIDVPALSWDWNDLPGYLDRLQASQPAMNIVQLAGHGGIRDAVMGYENRPATRDELSQMQTLLAEMFDLGLFGLSTGLGYAPDFYSNENELCALAEVVKAYDRVFTFHVRGERKTLFKAVNEAINVSRRTGANVQVSHLKCPDAINMGRMPEMLAMFDQAAQEGLPVNFDQYPYTAGSAYMGLLFPPWAHEGGMDRFLERLSDKTLRMRIQSDMMTGVGEWSSFLQPFLGKNILVAGSAAPEGAFWEGKRLSDIAADMGCSVAEAACRMMLASHGRTDMVMFQQDEEDLVCAMRHPMGMFGSDGFAMDQGEIIRKGTPHPRSFGTFPRVLAEYVRKRHVISLEEAIRRMTGAPAQKLRLQDRGFIQEGYFADIVLFDEHHIQDMATYDQPCQYAKGIEWVFVNGQVAKTPFGILHERHGRVLLRKKVNA